MFITKASFIFSANKSRFSFQTRNQGKAEAPASDPFEAWVPKVLKEKPKELSTVAATPKDPENYNILSPKIKQKLRIFTYFSGSFRDNSGVTKTQGKKEALVRHFIIK